MRPMVAAVPSSNVISGDNVMGVCPIFIIKIEIRADHREIQNIEPGDPVQRIDEFVDDPAEVSDHDDDHKVGALAVHDTGVQRLENGDGPADAETDEHEGFEEMHGFIIQVVLCSMVVCPFL